MGEPVGSLVVLVVLDALARGGGGGDGLHRRRHVPPHRLVHPPAHRPQQPRAHAPSHARRQHEAKVTLLAQRGRGAQLEDSQALADGVVAEPAEVGGADVAVDEGAGRVDGDGETLQRIVRRLTPVRHRPSEAPRAAPRCD